MFDALYISATGMQAQQLNVDTIANNLANVNTTGFKKSKVGFTDLMVREAARLLPAQEGAGVLGGTNRLGAGVGVAGVSKLFDMGDLKKTESAFDVAIQGEGFLEVTMPDGSSAYTRGGTFKVNRDGLLATQGGYPLKPNLAIPDNAQNMQIDSDGRVRIQVAGQSTPVELGQLELVRFTSPSALLAQGDNLYRSSTNSGEAISGRATEDGMGSLAQGFLEGSNVKLTEEMVNLMVAQRVYEANVKVIQASDEMLGMINGLRK
ncbi:flagellar basal-body rod protein FlgG [Variovorax sp. OV700]|uniref:flagellar basal-body rod protein FlgG n=1 Tax=Variovorax sp. OV700 TaxID=1882826 RepID=UPI00087FE624|nr:flagellar basal-body rod protein FlgG [Variovorax sp. OV700]SDJ59836.1 flagellar basal-body rod protein FlgG [Variovorax sp. OV700]